MSNINKQALRESAESTIGILENIAGFEPSDIDGDTVELRFETKGGFDTGCDVSIVDQCQKAADVVRALLDELEAAEKRIDILRQDKDKVIDMSTERVSKLLARAEDAEKRVAELKAREVKLPQRYSMLHRTDFDESYQAEMVYKQHQVLEALHDAGIRINGED